MNLNRTLDESSKCHKIIEETASLAACAKVLWRLTEESFVGVELVIEQAVNAGWQAANDDIQLHQGGTRPMQVCLSLKEVVRVKPPLEKKGTLHPF